MKYSFLKLSFFKDIGTYARHCKQKHPYTKGKDESANRFMSWLIPYNHEFENEKELIKIIEEINLKVNKQVDYSTGIASIILVNYFFFLDFLSSINFLYSDAFIPDQPLYISLVSIAYSIGFSTPPVFHISVSLNLSTIPVSLFLIHSSL